MINLFNIPNYLIDTSKFNHILHGDIVEEFTENFCKYVGALYGCAVNSATSAIFLLSYYHNDGWEFKIPTMLPPVVLNSIINGGCKYSFVDNIYWIGGSYELLFNDEVLIIDSTQSVLKKPNNYSNHNTIVIYSFYPTKPVGSCDGGMICSNNKGTIDFFKTIVMNGTEFSQKSWERTTKTPGWKMYMNSIQAYIANENLKKLDEKKHNLKIIREKYNCEFKLGLTSDHLYTILVENNEDFIKYMKAENIQCGIHYKCLHRQEPYKWQKYNHFLPKSEEMENHIVSIPFHENLTHEETSRIIKCVKSYGLMELYH